MYRIKKQILKNQYRNINDLAYYLNIGIITPLSEYEKLNFVALSHIKKDNKYIILNTNLIKDEATSNFILCYLIAEYINSTEKEYISKFNIEELNIETYKLAQEINNRINTYKKLQKTK